MAPSSKHLRLVTYMCPSHPVELYELLLEYLEEAVGCECTLLYESRAAGPLPDRVDPFTSDTVDLAFMSTTSFIEILEERISFAELLPVTPVFAHPKNTTWSKGYYSEVIIHVDRKKHVKDFIDLRGCTWAYSSEESLSGNTIILRTLKELGENASFFGNTLKTGSHLSSVQMVLSKQAEAAAVDANTLAYNKKYLQDGGKDIVALQSIGPLPPYPIVINSRLPADMKKKLTQAFLSVQQARKWADRLQVFGVHKFVANSIDAYEKEKEIKESASGSGMSIRYY